MAFRFTYPIKLSMARLYFFKDLSLNIKLYLIYYIICSNIVFEQLLYMGVVEMSVSYNKLWHLLIDKDMTKTELRNYAGVSTNVIAKLGRNESVSMDTLVKICAALSCDFADIVEMNGNGKGAKA